jgi:hypothetical protein
VNRLLKGKTVSWDWQAQWQMTFVFLQNLSTVSQTPPPLQSAVSEKNSQSPIWSQLLYQVRTYFLERS